jgi:hypothetical protein
MRDGIGGLEKWIRLLVTGARQDPQIRTDSGAGALVHDEAAVAGPVINIGFAGAIVEQFLPGGATGILAKYASLDLFSAYASQGDLLAIGRPNGIQRSGLADGRQAVVLQIKKPCFVIATERSPVSQ